MLSHQIHCQYLSQEALLASGCLDVMMAMQAAEDALKSFNRGDVIFPDKIVQIFDDDTQERINCLPATFKNHKICGVKWVSALFLICLLMMERLMFLQLLRPSGRWGVSNLPTCDVVHFRRTILECLTPSQVPLYQMICLFHKLNHCCKLTLCSCCLSLIGCTIFQFSHWKYQK